MKWLDRAEKQKLKIAKTSRVENDKLDELTNIKCNEMFIWQIHEGIKTRINCVITASFLDEFFLTVFFKYLRKCLKIVCRISADVLTILCPERTFWRHGVNTKEFL